MGFHSRALTWLCVGKKYRAQEQRAGSIGHCDDRCHLLPRGSTLRASVPYGYIMGSDLSSNSCFTTQGLVNCGSLELSSSYL